MVSFFWVVAGFTFIVLFLTSPDAKLHTQLSRLHKNKYTNAQGANTQIRKGQIHKYKHKV
jgi:hypothetical protein